MKAHPSQQRVDARDKLRASVRYIRDEKIPGMWYGGTVRSRHARARIKNIIFDASFNWDTVTTVTAGDIPYNIVSIIEKDMPFLAGHQVNYHGEPIALIAAPDKVTLRRALDAVTVEYEPLPAVLDMHEAEGSSIPIFGEDNVFKKILISKGSLDAAREKAFRKIELESRTGYQEHLYLEPQSMIAIPEKDRIVIKGSLQCPYYMKNAITAMFDHEKHITIIQAPTGGAFGGKEDFPSLLGGHAAILAVKSGHPVAMFYDRQEDVRVTTKRHPSWHRHVAWVDAQGRILGLEINMLLDGGAYCTLSPVVLARAALTAGNTYYIPNVQIDARAVATNTVPSGAFRGFGGPQAVFATEMLMEKIALELGLPAEEVRRLNLIREGQDTPTGQVLKYSVSSEMTFEDVLKMSGYKEKIVQFRQHNEPILEKLRRGAYPKVNPADRLRGIGICSFQHGAGFTGTGENKIEGEIRIEINAQGQPVIFTAITEMGQGEQTVFRKILAEALHISRDEVLLSEVNTDRVPDSGPTVASRSTMIIGELLTSSAKDIIAAISETLSREQDSQFEFLQGYFYGAGRVIPFGDAARRIAGKAFMKKYRHPPIIRFDDINWKGDAYPVFSWAAAVAEVEVDPVTFETAVRRYYTSHEIGKALNYDQAVAQIHGGSLQGIGYALYEKISLQDGHFDITGFTDYIIPATTEMPEMEVNILENPYPFGPFGAKGLGEMPLVGAAPAVLSALWMIFSREFSHIPVLPEDLAKLFERESE